MSHILAARLSSRPMAWSTRGVDQMAQLQAMKANGVSLRDRYITQHRCELKSLKVCQVALEEERQRLRKVVGEVFEIFLYCEARFPS